MLVFWREYGAIVVSYSRGGSRFRVQVSGPVLQPDRRRAGADRSRATARLRVGFRSSGQGPGGHRNSSAPPFWSHSAAADFTWRSSRRSGGFIDPVINNNGTVGIPRRDRQFHAVAVVTPDSSAADLLGLLAEHAERGKVGRLAARREQSGGGGLPALASRRQPLSRSYRYQVLSLLLPG